MREATSSLYVHVRHVYLTGKYVNNQGASSCERCAAGQFAALTNQTECQAPDRAGLSPLTRSTRPDGSAAFWSTRPDPSGRVELQKIDPTRPGKSGLREEIDPARPDFCAIVRKIR